MLQIFAMEHLPTHISDPHLFNEHSYIELILDFVIYTTPIFSRLIFDGLISEVPIYPRLDLKDLASSGVLSMLKLLNRAVGGMKSLTGGFNRVLSGPTQLSKPHDGTPV